MSRNKFAVAFSKPFITIFCNNIIKKIPDKKIEDIVNNWPQNFMANRAIELGFVADKDFKDIIQIYINEEINT